ncbi:T6SS effector BTH_I2691 family protein [Pseudomonas asiatica]|uniref:T6SS effector BTH_I2691 family protein n=1 Tax=Pseudomonas asiatica TaxID=2219225 RepID=UPI0025A31F9E|nr:T6SS effector BTH_I2691 family protein [Pseudomonas asiatica]WJN52741.1 T6SS effector BTH_I2691 family protein [Pseudomonas asiatica]
MSISKAIHIAMQEEIPNTYGTCNACERSGLPILLLREAYAPRPDTGRPYRLADDSEIIFHPMHTDQLRLLRQGYVYVLLDQEIWQAYEVAAEGTLQRFPVSQMPFGPPRSLPKVCATEGHDVIASFINIDTLLYRKAWIAFANDPWPRAVLDRYRQGIADSDPGTLARFVEVDLNTARNDPASLGIAMTDSFRFGLEQVLEFSTFSSARFTSAHGFYSRLGRWHETRTHVRNVIQQEQLPNGLLALTLPDPVGMVMELNAQRTGWVQALQEWRAQPQRHFEYFTSQALLGIRELHAAMAAVQGAEDAQREARQVEQWNDSPIAAKAYLPPVDIDAQTERNTARKQQDARERLEERYDESARAAFQADYDRELKNWQSMIDQVGDLYARHYAKRAFQQIGYYDYDATSPVSVEYFIQMMAACLAGGPTETLPQEGQPLGITQHIWQQLLEDDRSLLYQALLAKNQKLMQQVANALSGDDFGKVYDIIKGIAGTADGQLLMIKPIQDAVGQLLAATNSAGNALSQHLSERTKTLIGHVHRSAFALFAGQQVTPLRVSLTVGEYMSLLNEALEARTDAFLQQVDKQFRDPLGRKVRAMVLSGAINIAAAGNRSQMIEVMLWTLESAESLQARLVQLRVGAAGGVGALVRHVAIGAGTLRAQVSDGLKISSIAAQNMASDAMRSMRDAATSTGSVGLLLTLGSIWFQQDSLGKNYRALHETNTSNPEALATIWSSSLGVLGASVETAGFTIALVRPNPEWPGTITNSSLASKLARYGGAITAMAGLMDGAQYAFATFRTIENGDNTASSKYRIASATAFLSTFSGVAVAFGKAALLGPLGITIVLVLATYTLATIAKRKESTPTELWSRRCRWGIPTAQRAWSEAEHLDAAIGALNAATLGVQADARVNLSLASNVHLDTAAPEGTIISDGHTVPAVFMLDFHFTLPNYQNDRSYYHWELHLYQSGLHENTTILSGESAPNSVLTITQPSNVNIFPLSNEKRHQSKFDSERGVFTTQYSLPLHDNHHIRDIKFILDYRPNKNDDTGNARLEIKENKIKNKDL